MEMQATCLHVGVERQQEQERRDSRKNDGTSKEELKLKEEELTRAAVCGEPTSHFPGNIVAYIIVTAPTSYPDLTIS